MNRNKWILWIAAILISTGIAAQENNTQRMVVPLTKPGQRGLLEVELMNGSIKVAGYSGKEVIVEAEALTEESMYKVNGNEFFPESMARVEYRVARSPRGWTPRSDKEEEEDHINRSTDGMKKIGAASFQLTAEEKDNRVVVESDSWHRGVNLTIQVPENFDLKLVTINNGELMVENIDGTIELENMNGPITATGISGSAVTNSANGSARVEFEKVNPDTPMSFSTLNGDIELLLPASAKATLKMKTEMGEIFTDFDMDIRQHDPKVEREKSSGKYKVSVTKWIYGEINGGGPELTLQSMHGDFFIRKK